jgi:hypothetical protein
MSAADSDADRDALSRWRLVLGKAAEAHEISCAGGDYERIEQLIGFLFEDAPAAAGGTATRRRGSGREGGRGGSVLSMPQWVDGVAELFPHQAKEVLERELVQRRGIAELLQQPQLLE